jgi:HTH-type transcriptional regulator/antitoxin HigA
MTSGTILIRPITNDADHAAAVAQLTTLWGNANVEAEIDALVTLIDAYEARQWPMSDTLDPVDMIKHAMTDDVGHTRAELVALLGSPSRVSEILARKRPLTLDMIRVISREWGIPVELLTAPYALGAHPRKA